MRMAAGVLDREPTQYDATAGQQCCGPPIANADTVETIHQRSQCQTGERKSDQVKWAPFRLTRFCDISKDHDHSGHTERNVEKEYPSPIRVGRDEPADRRSENPGQEPRPSRDRRDPPEIAVLGISP